MTQTERIEKRLEKLEAIAEANSIILHNGIRDKVSLCEKAVKTVEAKLIELAILVGRLAPKPEMPFWKRFAFKWVGTFVILLMFIGVVWLAFAILPHDVVDRVITKAIEVKG